MPFMSPDFIYSPIDPTSKHAKSQLDGAEAPPGPVLRRSRDPAVEAYLNFDIGVVASRGGGLGAIGALDERERPPRPNAARQDVAERLQVGHDASVRPLNCHSVPREFLLTFSYFRSFLPPDDRRLTPPPALPRPRSQRRSFDLCSTFQLIYFTVGISPLAKRNTAPPALVRRREFPLLLPLSRTTENARPDKASPRN